MVRKTLTRDQAKLGAWTRDRVVKLGPTFIKLGQIVSTRSDVYPREFVKELESLQDDVPSVPLGDTVEHFGVSNIRRCPIQVSEHRSGAHGHPNHR
jgi:predicted unusual protein kinase regulating ubiquinone biosynthesis (AarF/ABC1/UbiB family)